MFVSYLRPLYMLKERVQHRFQPILTNTTTVAPDIAAAPDLTLLIDGSKYVPQIIFVL